MMGHCDCGSYAINPALHGREPGKNLNLCDVCYWREEVKHLTAELASETKWAHDYQREAEALRTQPRPTSCGCDGLSATDDRTDYSGSYYGGRGERMKIANCKEGHEAGPVEQDGYWYVCCHRLCCWRGPDCYSETEAIAAWNAVMGDGWIECSERMPEIAEIVIVEMAKGMPAVRMGRLNGSSDFVCGPYDYRPDQILRWQPMPKGKGEK